jgi:hypothetical protein
MKTSITCLLANLAVSFIVMSSAVGSDRDVAQAQWLKSATQELQSRGAPSTELMHTLQPGQWAGHGFILFTNGWASFAYHTFHDSEEIGDVALLRTSDGIFYVSHFHFCVGEAEFWAPHKIQPKDFSQFLELYGAKQDWKKKPDA